MSYSENFYLDIHKIYIAHHFTLNWTNKYSYPKGRGQYGLVYAVSGKAEYRFASGEKFIVKPGNLLFLTPSVAYSIITKETFEHYTVNFDLHTEHSNLQKLTCPYCILNQETTESMQRVFKRLVEIWQYKKTGYEMHAVGCLYELMSLFYLDYTEGQNSASFTRLSRAREHIEQHYTESINLEQLAWISSMSTSHFRREWKKFYTESPLQFRDSIRLHYAKEYLKTGYYTICEIAKKCGFQDVSYFVRFFKKKTALTPGEFKRNFSIS